MGRTELLQGLRTMKFETLLDRWQRSELSQAEAAEALGMSERSFRRWHTRWLEEGEAGLHDRRLGQPSPRRMDAGVVSAGIKLTHLAGVKLTHLGKDGGQEAADVDPGGSSGDPSFGKTRGRSSGDSAADGLFAQHGAAISA